MAWVEGRGSLLCGMGWGGFALGLGFRGVACVCAVYRSLSICPKNRKKEGKRKKYIERGIGIGIGFLLVSILRSFLEPLFLFSFLFFWMMLLFFFQVPRKLKPLIKERESKPRGRRLASAGDLGRDADKKGPGEGDMAVHPGEDS